MKRSPMPPPKKPMSRGTSQLGYRKKDLVKCKVIGCPVKFLPRNARHIACCEDHAVALVTAAREKEERAAAKRERQQDAEKKVAFMSLAKLKEKLQKAVNAFIRERDRDDPCICCGKWGEEWSAGGIWDAGHYRSRGSADHLRFDERNIHKQLKQCNSYGAGNVTGYRIGLIRKIGIEQVEALESDQRSFKWTRDWLIAKEKEYVLKLKELVKTRDPAPQHLPAALEDIARILGDRDV